MKVVFDHQIFSLQVNGGISRYISKLCEGLNELGVNAIIKVSWSENVYLSNKKSLPKWLPWRLRQISYLILNQLDDYFHPIRDIDVLHFTYYGQTPQSRYTKKTAITVFDMIHENGLIKPSMFDKTVAHKQKIVQHTDLIFTISESTKSEMLQCYSFLRENDIHVTYLGTDISKFQNTPLKAKIDYRYILYVGNRAGYKNFMPYLTAIAPILKQKKIHFIAFGGGRFSKEETAQLIELGVNNLVHQVSGDDELLATYYKQALFLAYPSLSEGFGLPIIEAFALGCPVLTSNRSSMKEIANNLAVLINPFDKKDMLIKSIYLLKIKKPVGLKGKLITYSKIFSWKNCALDTLKIYTMITQFL